MIEEEVRTTQKQCKFSKCRHYRKSLIPISTGVLLADFSGHCSMPLSGESLINVSHPIMCFE